jgi:hypothetical protein
MRKGNLFFRSTVRKGKFQLSIPQFDYMVSYCTHDESTCAVMAGGSNGDGAKRGMDTIHVLAPYENQNVQHRVPI